MRIMRISWMWYIGRMEQLINTHRTVVIKPGEKRPVGRLWRWWEDNIKTDLIGMVYEDMGCFNQDRDTDRCHTVENAIMKFWVACWAGNVLTSWGSIRFWTGSPFRIGSTNVSFKKMSRYYVPYKGTYCLAYYACSLHSTKSWRSWSVLVEDSLKQIKAHVGNDNEWGRMRC